MKNAHVVSLAGAALMVITLGCKGSSQVVPEKLSPLVTVPPNQWLACHKNAQCSATSLSCHGWIAINRSHETDVQEWYSRENAGVLSVVECSGPLKPKPDAVCRRNICQLK